MSLINDALKRASTGSTPPPATPLMSPVPEESRATKPWLLFLILIGAAILGGLWLRRAANEDKPHQAAPVAETPAATAPAAANPVQRTQAVLETVQERNELNTAVPATASRGPGTAPAARPFPDLQLQAIYFRMKNPTVMINGKTLAQGDSVEGARLISISRTSAEVEFEGIRKTLSLQ